MINTAGRNTLSLDGFQFRDVHPDVSIGTASDRYAGWIGQIYSEGRYQISTRSKGVGGELFKEETLPVESVKEYFEHFSILELDFTFYRTLLDKDLRPTPNYRVLQTYKKYLDEDDRVILKAPRWYLPKNCGEGANLLRTPTASTPASLHTDSMSRPLISWVIRFMGLFLSRNINPRRKGSQRGNM